MKNQLLDAFLAMRLMRSETSVQFILRVGDKESSTV